MLIIARSYGVTVRAFPVAGAEFAYAYHACGRYHAYVCGWFLALGTAFGYVYTCFAAAQIAHAGQVDTGPGDRRLALLGAALSAGFIVLLAAPGMPAFMATPSWIALAAWVGLGLAFFASRAGEYRALPARELDHLILRR